MRPGHVLADLLEDSSRVADTSSERESCRHTTPAIAQARFSKNNEPQVAGALLSLQIDCRLQGKRFLATMSWIRRSILASMHSNRNP